MHCPGCGKEMTQERVREVIVDICSHCRGVWFDPGELAVFLEKKSEASSPEGVFLSHDELEKLKHEIREDKIEKRVNTTLEVGDTLSTYAWDLPFYLIEGILDLFSNLGAE